MNFHRLGKLLIVLAFVLVSLAQFQPVSALGDPVTNVRIGLYWDSTALPSANLENYIGSGYKFGYFDSNRNFVELGSTDIKTITMLKDWNMYLSGGKYYDAAPSSGSYDVIGCYHIRLNTAYNTYNEAKAAISTNGSFVAYHNGRFYICVGSYTSYANAETAMKELGLDGTPMTASSSCVTVVKTGTTEILFQYDCGKESSLGIMPIAGENEKAKTWFKGYKYYGGFQYTRLTGENLTVVNFVNMEDYVKGILPYEMNPEWPIEALKAQAVTARTYTASHLNNHKSSGFDLCNGPHCQTYGGANGATDNSDSAVDQTRGIYMTYNGDYAETYYFSSDGGATENCENVFSEAIPYLKGKLDPYEQHVQTKHDSWSFTYTKEDITNILRLKNYNCGNIVAVTPVYTELGNIYSLAFLDDRGVTWKFSKFEASTILYSPTYQKYTYSMRFTVKAAGGETSAIYVNSAAKQLGPDSEMYVISGSDGSIKNISGRGGYSVITEHGTETISMSGSGTALYADSYIISGSGWGHNVGMSQYGAKAMAELGYNYQDILNFYFSGVTISVN
jgi:stage II sporulation protein D